MAEIRSCPFCGGEAHVQQAGAVGWVVQCTRCEVWNAGYRPHFSHRTDVEFAGYVSEEAAVNAWNRRVASDGR